MAGTRRVRLALVNAVLAFQLYLRRERPSVTAADVLRWPLACWIGRAWFSPAREARTPLDGHVVKPRGPVDTRRLRPRRRIWRRLRLRYSLRRWLRIGRSPRRAPVEPR